MIDPLSLDFLTGALSGAVVIAPGTYAGARKLRKLRAERRHTLARYRTRPAADPRVSQMVDEYEGALSVAWAEFRRRFL